MNTEPTPKLVPPIVGLCVQCRGPVRVPAVAEPTDRVRCPHCQAIYTLDAFFQQSIPELEVVSPDAPQALPRVDRIEIDTAKDAAGRFVVPSQLSEGARRRRRRRSGADTENDAAASSRAASDTRSGREPRERYRTASGQSSSAAMEAVKVVLGGAMAIPIAYLLMFWVFRQDPLDLGPRLSDFVPGLVPAEFRRQSDLLEEETVWRQHEQGLPNSAGRRPLV